MTILASTKPRCTICGVKMASLEAGGKFQGICKNITCYEATIDFIKKELEEAKGISH